MGNGGGGERKAWSSLEGKGESGKHQRGRMLVSDFHAYSASQMIWDTDCVLGVKSGGRVFVSKGR